MKKLKKNNTLIFSIIIFATIIFLTIGYSVFTDSLSITDVVSHVRVDKVVRINGVTSGSSAISNLDYSSKSILNTVYIPAGESITYNVTVTNLGNVPVAVSDVSFTSGGNNVSGLSANVTPSNYQKVCDNNVCTGGVSTIIPVTITNNGSTTIDMNLDVNLTFTEVYEISYDNNLLGEALAGSNYTYSFNSNAPSRLAKISGNCDDYNYTSGTLTITNVGSDISFTEAYTITYNGEVIGTVTDGGNFSKNLEPAFPESVTIESGNYDNHSYSNHILSITNVRSDIVVSGVIGKVQISRIQYVQDSAKNVLDNPVPTPTFNDMDVSFSITFQRPEGSTEEDFEITYEVDVTNSHYNDYIFRGFDFHPTINASASSDTATLELIPTGIANGDTIASGTTKTFRVTLRLDPSNSDGSYSTESITQVDATPDTEEETGTITATVTPLTGNLKSPNTRATFVVEVTNTFPTDKEFRLISSNSSLEVVPASGNQLIVHGESTEQYTVYVQAAEGATFINNTASMTMYLNSSGMANVVVDTLTLDVDVYDVPDTTKVTVGNAAIAYYYDKSDKKPKIKATWNRIDIGGTRITDYVVGIYTTNGSLVQTCHTGSASRECLFSGLSENTNYYVIVYGIDEAGNSGENDVSSATTSNGFATRSATNSFKWKYSVNTSKVTDLTVGGDGSTAILGASHKITVTASGSSYGIAYTAPESVTVTMDGSSGNFYTYARSGTNNTVGTITINEVTGNISVTAERAGGCLIAGTKILLANGNYKNIEKINYDDLLAVWNYDTGSITYTYPAFIENEVFVDSYLKTTFDDGTTLNTYAAHGVYSYDLNRYILTTDTENYKVGSKIVKIIDGKIKVVTIKKLEMIKEDIKVYHIVTNGYFNLIADDVLTTDPNILISNQYGFIDNIKWPIGTRETIINNTDNLYSYDLFSDIMPYYMFRALRVDEGKFVVNQGMISFELLKMYLASNPSNPNYFKDLPKNANGKRLITVTTSLDDVNLFNKYKYQYEEGSYYTLPSRYNIKCFLNTTNNTCYEGGSKIKVDTSTHFIVIYK